MIELNKNQKIIIIVMGIIILIVVGYYLWDRSKEASLIIEQEETEEIQENNMENNIERDAFIEELRRHIENDKSDKELAYIEQHKAKVKTQEDVEKEF